MSELQPSSMPKNLRLEARQSRPARLVMQIGRLPSATSRKRDQVINVLIPPKVRNRFLPRRLANAPFYLRQHREDLSTALIVS